MSKHRSINYNHPIPQDWLDALQEFISTQVSPNIVVSVLNPTTLRLPAGSDNAQVAIGINGKWRYNSANADAAPPGDLVVGDNPLFVAASDNTFTDNPGGNEIDGTDYSFRLIVKTVGATPSGTGAQALWRQIGTATWNGTAFTDVRLTVGGTLARHATTHNPSGSDALDWAAIAQTIGPYGTLAARPSPVSGNRGFRYVATDTNGGTLYANLTGSAWAQAAAGAAHALTHLPGGADAIAWPSLFQRGTLAARGAYGANFVGLQYFATDVNGGTIYRGSSELGAWEQIAPAMTHGASHAPGGADPIGYAAVNLTNTYLSRPAAATGNAGLLFFATDTLGVWRSTGSAWVLVAQGRPRVIGSDLDSAPFTTPYNGQEVLLVDAADSTYGIHLTWNSSVTDAYKWVVTGGRLTSYDDNEDSYTDATEHTLTGVTVTVPRTGLYGMRVALTAYTNASVGSFGATVKVKNAAGTQVGPATKFNLQGSDPEGAWTGFEAPQVALTAGDVLTLRATKTAAANATSWKYRHKSIVLEPIRVS